MNKKILITTLALGAAFAGTLFAAAQNPETTVSSKVAATSTPAGWTDDFEAAKKQAAEEGKYLLVDFSGSDWCGWCVKLDKEVFSKKEFLDGAKKKFVLVFIDSPKKREKLSPLAQKQNPKLVEQYKIEGFPSVLLMDAEGTPLATLGYQKGGAENYLKLLDSVLAEKLPILDLEKKIKAMEPGSEERVKAIHEVLKDAAPGTQIECRDLVGEVLAFDKDGSAGMRDAYPLITVFMPVAKAQRTLFEQINEEMRERYGKLPAAEKNNADIGAKIRRAALENNREKLEALLKLISETAKTAPEKYEIREKLESMEESLARLLESLSEK